ncbi:MAG: amino acid adenylation domain-containing protein [Saprospiraceae bacterium]
MPEGLPIPLSLGQQRLWFLQQLYPDNPFYHYADVLRLKGVLHADHLEASFQQLAQRHAILRTSFPAENGEPTQRIGEKAQIEFLRYDLRSIATDQQTKEAEKLAIKCASQAFNLAEGPLTRIALIQLAEDDHWLVLCMHHIITDKWSMELLRNDLAQVYSGLIAGKSVSLDPLPIQYGDYAYWQRKQPLDKNHLAYWEQKLAGELPGLKLPTDRPRPSQASFRGAFSKQIYSPSLSSQLKELSKQNNTTLFVLLLTAYKVLLHRYSGQEDILVGTPFTNRDQVALEPLIGFFNDTLVLRSEVAGDLSFLELVQQMRQTVMDAFLHKNTPFETLVRTLSPDRQMSANPLFQVMFLYHKVPERPSLGPDLSLTHEPFDLGVAKFDLTLYISEEADHLAAIFEYTTDLFEADTIQRMQGHLQVLLEAIVKHPEKPISALPILSDPEEQKLLRDWNNTYKELPSIKGIHHLLEAQAAQHPEALAAVYQGQQLSYQTLNERSNQVAGYLQARGIGQHAVVGLYAERSLEMVIGIWGILKAGAAYLPLDPEYPTERIQFMLEDAAVQYILSQEQLLSQLAGCQATVLSFDDPALSAAASTAFRSPDLTADALAYIIYTSGSTGRPKGVPVSHQNLLHSTTARFDYYPDQPDCFLLLSSFAFDSSVVGIFWTLCSGGTLVLPERRIEQDLNQLAQLIATHQVTHTLLLPSLYSVLLQHIQVEKFASLNTVVVAGEACSASLCRQHFDLLPGVGLYNEYGPTEASVWCTVHRVEAQDVQTIIPIGRPIANAEIYLLDKYRQAVPIGVAGELYVGGAGVTQGYLNRPELSAQHFIPNPFSPDVTSKLYRTGDLARYRKDGLIEFLGRADQQVKIRGYRIELDEIRENILQCHGVKDALVLLHQEAEARPRLLAYVIGLADLTAETLLQELRGKLPAYMVPASLVFLTEWPRLPNGKINQRALPAPGETSVANASNYRPASTAIEQQLIAIWEGVLHLHPIGIHDNFFEIGGDSILSIQIIAKARKAGLSMAPNQIFEHQTIAELALFIQASEKNTTQANQFIIGPTPLLPIQTWFFEEHRVAPHHWNQGFVFEVEALFSAELCRQAIAHIVSHHDALRLHFEKEGEKWRAAFLAPEKIKAFQSFSYKTLDTEAQNAAIEAQSATIQASFNLAQGSLFQAVYFECEPVQANRLLLVAHHLLVDAVSWQIIAEDLQTLGQQLLHGQSLALSPKTTSYRDWGNYLVEGASTQEWLKEYDFWLAQVQNATSLPVDFASSLPVSEASLETLHLKLDKATTQSLLKDVPLLYNTKTDEVLVTALLQAIEDWTGFSTLSIGLERHGREAIQEAIDLSATVGWFTAFYPARLQRDASADTGTNLKAIKEQLRKIPNGGIGYGVLRYLSEDRQIRENLQCNPSLLFNFLGQQDMLSSEILGKGQMLFSAARDPQSEMAYMLEINAFILDGQLEMRWRYSRDLHKAQTIIDLMGAFESALKGIIAYCLSTDNGSYTPSDFPEADLSQDDLDALLGQINF